MSMNMKIKRKRRWMVSLSAILLMTSVSVLSGDLPVGAEEISGGGKASLEASADLSVMAISQTDGGYFEEDDWLYLIECRSTGQYDSLGYGPDSEDYSSNEGYSMYRKFVRTEVKALLADPSEEPSLLDRSNLYVYSIIPMNADEDDIGGESYDYTLILSESEIAGSYLNETYEPAVFGITEEGDLVRLSFTYSLSDDKVTYSFATDCTEIVTVPMKTGWTEHLQTPDTQQFAVPIGTEDAEKGKDTPTEEGSEIADPTEPEEGSETAEPTEPEEGSEIAEPTETEEKSENTEPAGADEEQSQTIASKVTEGKAKSGISDSSKPQKQNSVNSLSAAEQNTSDKEKSKSQGASTGDEKHPAGFAALLLFGAAGIIYMAAEPKKGK